VIYALDTISTALLTMSIVLLFFADLVVIGIDFNEVDRYEWQLIFTSFAFFVPRIIYEFNK